MTRRSRLLIPWWGLFPALLTAVLGAQGSRPRSIDVVEATIDDVRAALQSGRARCRDVVDAYLRRIDAYDQAGPGLNAIQTVNPSALTEADRLDAAFAASGPVGPLHCVPMVVKDQVETKDLPTSYGSIVFKGFLTGRDATVVARLRTAGAVVIGKSTMGEFASGYLGSAFGAVRNAYDPTRMASGSSGGTGSAVAASFATTGIAEDTGGSTRGPAAVASLVGLRPTVPLVSRFGMLPARPSTDTLGPVGRSVKDVALVLDVIAGYDPRDAVTAESVGHVPATYTAFLAVDGLKQKRIGVLRAPLDPQADTTTPDYRSVRVVVDRAIADLQRLGAQIVEVPGIPGLAARSAAIYDDNVFETEAAFNAYLAEHSAAPQKTLAAVLLTGKVVPARARVLANALGHATVEPGYAKLMLARERLRRDVFALMANERLDAFAYATFDYPPPVIPTDALTRTTIDSAGPGNNRRLSPALGFPALTVPAGFTADGLPVGLELMARPFDEPTLFALAYAFEQGTHHRRPPKATPPLPADKGR
jgi:Asp-tRNA(Asn)/Glu-tRNA(Gln) amidotransferase A subunit family amidase